MVDVIVLGSAQDGGLPHVGCHRPLCERARRESAFARLAACLGVVDREAARTFMIDATPNLPAQLDVLDTIDAPRAGRNPIDGLLLTHAHIGHYAGLIHFGKEVMATRELPTWCTPRMAAFLRDNAPWSALVRDGNLAVLEVNDGDTIQLTPAVTARVFSVPHRADFTDTVGFELIGPQRRLLYIPDIDGWHDWTTNIREAVAAVDTALLDATFYSSMELPGRDMPAIPHPRIDDSMRLLEPVADRVVFTHLNHTNPAVDPESAEARAIAEAGFRVAREREVFTV